MPRRQLLTRALNKFPQVLNAKCCVVHSHTVDHTVVMSKSKTSLDMYSSRSWCWRELWPIYIEQNPDSYIQHSGHTYATVCFYTVTALFCSLWHTLCAGTLYTSMCTLCCSEQDLTLTTTRYLYRHNIKQHVEIFMYTYYITPHLILFLRALVW